MEFNELTKELHGVPTKEDIGFFTFTIRVEDEGQSYIIETEGSIDVNEAAGVQTMWYDYNSNNQVVYDGVSLVDGRLSINDQGRYLEYNNLGQQTLSVNAGTAYSYNYSARGFMTDINQFYNKTEVNLIDDHTNLYWRNTNNSANMWGLLQHREYNDVGQVEIEENFYGAASIGESLTEVTLPDKLQDPDVPESTETFFFDYSFQAKSKTVTNYDHNGRANDIVYQNTVNNWMNNVSYSSQPDETASQDGTETKPFILASREIKESVQTTLVYNDDTGQLASKTISQTVHNTPSPDNQGFTHNLTYQYDKREQYQEKTIGGTSNSNFEPATTTSHYNALGQRTYINVAGEEFGKRLDYNQQGQIIRKSQGVGESAQESHYLFSQGKFLGELDKNGSVNMVGQHFSALNSDSSTSSSLYTVNNGDTLRSIAMAFYGDDNLWYLIADANGLSSGEPLNAGQTLDIPHRANTSNNFETFKPYNPAELVGDTTPNLAYAPPAPSAEGCNVLASIIIIVVAVVVTVATQGALAGQVAGWAGTAIGSGAIAGAAGSIASQVVGIGLGQQEGFNWGQVAMAAVGGGIGGGISEAAGVGNIEQSIKGVKTSLTTLNKAGSQYVLNGLGRAVTAAGSGVGVAAVSKVINGHSGFSWANIAASAASASIGGRLPGEGLNTNGFGNDLLMRVASSAVGYGVNRAFGGDRSWNGRDVVVDAFGNALGNSIVSGLSKPPSLTAKEQADLERFSRISGQAASDKVNGVQRNPDGSFKTDAITEQLNQQSLNTGNAVGAQAASIAESLVKTTSVNSSVRDVSGINALSAKYKTDLASLTQRHNEQMYSVQMTLANDQWLLGGNKLTPVTYDPLTPTPNPLPKPVEPFNWLGLEENASLVGHLINATEQATLFAAKNSGQSVLRSALPLQQANMVKVASTLNMTSAADVFKSPNGKTATALVQSTAKYGTALKGLGAVGVVATGVEEGAYLMDTYNNNPDAMGYAVGSSVTNVAGDITATYGGMKIGASIGSFFAPFTFGLSIPIGAAIGGIGGHLIYDNYVKPEVRVGWTGIDPNGN